MPEYLSPEGPAFTLKFSHVHRFSHCEKFADNGVAVKTKQKTSELIVSPLINTADKAIVSPLFERGVGWNYQMKGHFTNEP